LILPKSLAGRTILILLIGFALVQMLGLFIHTLNQINLQRIEEEQVFATRAVIIYRHIALGAPGDRMALVAREALPKGDTLVLSLGPPSEDDTYDMPISARQIIRASLFSYGIPPGLRPRGIVLRATGIPPHIIISFGMPDGAELRPPAFDRIRPPSPVGGMVTGGPGDGPYGPPPGAEIPPHGGNGMGAPPASWLTLTSELSPPAPWRSPGFATAFIVMTLLGAVMIFWAVRQLLVPVRTLAQAAERLGRDVVNAPALPETGPSEIVTAAAAFNTMAARIRRFVEDRTFLLTAIGHDLRTPITRLKLRAEYMEDDEQRLKMLADLDEMEAMVAATLAFGRDITTSEPVTRINLATLLRTILDDAADGDPEHADALSFDGPNSLPISARPLGLKRALTNLIGNALKYGDSACVSLRQMPRDLVQIDIDDNGPGIDVSEMDVVFEPFRRLETSRNRETGGSGLGLSIARNIIRAHGGDILLQNLPAGGLRVRVTLPV
jgi:signal transduction histidine kinase